MQVFSSRLIKWDISRLKTMSGNYRRMSTPFYDYLGEYIKNKNGKKSANDKIFI